MNKFKRKGFNIEINLNIILNVKKRIKPKTKTSVKAKDKIITTKSHLNILPLFKNKFKKLKKYIELNIREKLKCKPHSTT